MRQRAKPFFCMAGLCSWTFSMLHVAIWNLYMCACAPPPPCVPAPHKLWCCEAFQQQAVPCTRCQLSCAPVCLLLSAPADCIIHTAQQHPPGVIQQAGQLQVVRSHPQHPVCARGGGGGRRQRHTCQQAEGGGEAAGSRSCLATHLAVTTQFARPASPGSSWCCEGEDVTTAADQAVSPPPPLKIFHIDYCACRSPNASIVATHAVPGITPHTWA
jgi:hypothetical protein